MRPKQLGLALLFPHPAILLILLPVSAVFLVYAMVYMGSDSPVAIASYVLAAYTLTVWCLRIPRLLRFFKAFRAENRFAVRWQEDLRLRMNISLYSSLLINTAYAVLQLGLGFYHASFWYFGLAAYYISLAVMRFFLVRYTTRHRPGEHIQAEHLRYRACGTVLLLMNLALALIIFFMVYWNRTFRHHEITTITMAAYTFWSLAFAIVGIVRHRRAESPVLAASDAIRLAAASVSMLTLESTMLTTFGEETTDLFTRRMLLGISGGAISFGIIAMAVYMIAHGTKQIKLSKAAKE